MTLEERRRRRKIVKGSDMSSSRKWVVVWSDVHYDQDFESDEGSQEAALDEACDLLRVGHKVKCIIGPNDVIIRREQIEQYCHARSPPP
jgi:hypothetical protein